MRARTRLDPCIGDNKRLNHCAIIAVSAQACPLAAIEPSLPVQAGVLGSVVDLLGRQRPARPVRAPHRCVKNRGDANVSTVSAVVRDVCTTVHSNADFYSMECERSSHQARAPHRCMKKKGGDANAFTVSVVRDVRTYILKQISTAWNANDRVTKTRRPSAHKSRPRLICVYTTMAYMCVGDSQEEKAEWRNRRHTVGLVHVEVQELCGEGGQPQGAREAERCARKLANVHPRHHQHIVSGEE